eukprot:COSAG02_NODE_3372_length_6852_cov_9.984451_4_plen_130_part_00
MLTTAAMVTSSDVLAGLAGGIDSHSGWIDDVAADIKEAELKVCFTLLPADPPRGVFFLGTALFWLGTLCVYTPLRLRQLQRLRPAPQQPVRPRAHVGYALYRRRTEVPLVVSSSERSTCFGMQQLLGIR